MHLIIGNKGVLEDSWTKQYFQWSKIEVENISSVHFICLNEQLCVHIT